MNLTLLLDMPGPVWGTAMLLTAVVIIYSIAKALMRYNDNHKNEK